MLERTLQSRTRVHGFDPDPLHAGIAKHLAALDALRRNRLAVTE